MTISIGDKLPEANLLKFTDEGPQTVNLHELLNGKAVLFGLPGAYTRTCHAEHMPSFTKNADAIRAKGVSEIICISVNDPFVLAHWAKETGADAAGIHVLGDADASLTKALGLTFSADVVGLFDRSQRYSMIVEDGVVTDLDIEEPGTCSLSTGDAILAKL